MSSESIGRWSPFSKTTRSSLRSVRMNWLRLSVAVKMTFSSGKWVMSTFFMVKSASPLTDCNPNRWPRFATSLRFSISCLCWPCAALPTDVTSNKTSRHLNILIVQCVHILNGRVSFRLANSLSGRFVPFSGDLYLAGAANKKVRTSHRGPDP